MNIANIELLKRSLQGFGYHCSGGEGADPHMEVILGRSEEGEIWRLLMAFNELPLEPHSGGAKAYFLQLYLEFPYLCETSNIANVARLLLMFNKSLPFPAFGLSEVEGKMYYKNTLYCDKGIVPIPLACSLVGILALYLDSLSPIIKAVALGTHQLHEVLENVLKLEEVA